MDELQERLAIFGAYVLKTMDECEEWGADMVDEIANRSKDLNLSAATSKGTFVDISGGQS